MKIMMTHSLTFQKSPPETKVFSSVYLQCALETKQNFIVKADRFSQKVPEPTVCMGYVRWSKININLDNMSCCVLCAALAWGLVQFNNIAYLSVCIVAEQRGLITIIFSQQLPSII